MTGFGSASVDTGEGSVVVEVRSVNGRGLALRCSLPPGTEGWEPELRELVSARLERGQVELALRLGPGTVESGTTNGRSGGGLELDTDRVEALLKAFRRLREEYALRGPIDLPLLVRAGPILRERSHRPAESFGLETVLEVAGRALDGLVEMRRSEGARLAEAFRGHLAAMDRRLRRVEAAAPRRLERARERLREAVRELAAETALDDDRLAREVALLADRWDLGEELERSRSHLEAFGELLEEEDGTAVGRRLKFLAQELHREVNTLGAKANDAEISREVVELKHELETLREQVENVE